MDRGLLDEVLSCPTLPTLPSVAAEIIELTSDRDVPMKRIAQCVQRDQALAGKVLKTVNSSYYGLLTPCCSIERAMAFLGMNTVKSLVLGFSLVDVTRTAEMGRGFDLLMHWRRAIVGAVSSRQVAVLTRSADPDEAFLAALFQDVGCLACHVALRGRYDRTVEGLDHADWESAERRALGFSHAEVGAELTRKWKLPAGVRAAVLAHHAPDSGPLEFRGLIRAVGLGSMVGAVLAQEAPIPTAVEIYRRSKAWFGDDAPEVEPLIDRAGADARVLAKLFNQDIGRVMNVQELMAIAQEKGLEHQLELQREAENLRKEATTDGLTGLPNRRSFDAALTQAFAGYEAGRGPVSVIFCDADRFKSVNDTHGHAAGDAVLIELAKRLTRAVGDAGTVARYGGEEIAVVLPGAGRDLAATLGERIREAVAGEPFDLSRAACDVDMLTVTVSVGVATTDGWPDRYDSARRLLQDADDCVYEAKRAGRNRVMVYCDGMAQAPAAAAAPMGTGGTRVLFVEDDPLAATLITTLLKRQPGVEIQWIESGTRAASEIARMSGGESPAADVFLVDLNLPGTSGYELLKMVRGSAGLRDKVFIVLSGEEGGAARAECLRLGASGFIPKQEFVTDIGRWLGMIVGQVREAA